MKMTATLVFSLMLMMNICDGHTGEQVVVMRQPSNHNCAVMKATVMPPAGMTEKLGTYASASQAIDAVVSFQKQDDPNNAAMKVCK